MRSYQFLSHTADVRLKVEADGAEELFTAALEGMGNLIKSGICKSKERQKTNDEKTALKEKIEISSIDITSLLIDFLSEILTYSQVNKAVYCKVKFEKLEGSFLSCTVFGTKVAGFDEDIKAVTHHEAEIKKNEQGNIQTIIIFDI